MTTAIRVWKDTLHPGRQQDRFGEWFTITQGDCRQARENVHKMLSRGLRIPICWEHQPTANPVFTKSPEDKLAAYARNTFGEIKGARIDPSGVLWCEHEVYDQQDANQLRKTKYVSPKLFPGFADSRGGTYQGTTIGHVAATPTPVQFWQKPFELSVHYGLCLSYARPDDLDPRSSTMAAPLMSDDKLMPQIVKSLERLGLRVGQPRDLADLTSRLEALAENAGSLRGREDDYDDLDDFDLDDEKTTTSAGAPPMLMSDGRGGRTPARRPSGPKAAKSGAEFLNNLTRRLRG